MADDYAGFGSYQPPRPPPSAGHDYATFGTYQPPAPKAYPRDIGAGESALRGMADSMTFGFAPAIEGLGAASGMSAPSRETSFKGIQERSSGDAAFRPWKGAYNLLFGNDSGQATRAYDKAREAAYQENQEAFEQHPGAYIGGQVGGALLTPLGSVSGDSLLARVWSATKLGAKAGALQGAGEAVSSGGGPYDAAIGAVKGAPLGAAFGGAGSAILEGAGRGLTRAGDIYRGAVRTEDQAARGMVGAMTADKVPLRDPGDFSYLSGAARTAAERKYARLNPNGQPPFFAGLDRETEGAADRAGLPILNIDRGGQTTRDLGRTAGNVSSDAWGALEQATQERADTRPQRIADTINRLFATGRARNPKNPLDAGADVERLQAQSRLANAPAYRAAYKAGDRPIWSPEMERLAGAPAIQDAMRSAVTSGQNRAIEQGMGAFNPNVRVTPDGRLLMGRPDVPPGGARLYGIAPGGVSTYPNIQYWDYVQRDLNDMVQKVQGREPDKARYLNSLHQQLNTELDRLVPQFQDARVGAWRFFQSKDAIEAGRKFVMMNADPREAARRLANMTDPDKELFARGFADELAQSVLRLPNTMQTLKRIFTSPAAQQKIRLGLNSPARARELEALMRAEAIAQKSKDALGNSTTARQQEMLRAFKATGAAHGIAGAGAVGAFEFLNDQDFDPRAILSTALIVGAVRGGAHRIDTRVMRRIGEMLASEDPVTMRRGVQAVAQSPKLFDALRRGTTAGTRITARDIGPEKALAGSAAILGDILATEEEHHRASHPDNMQTSPPQ